MKHEDRKTTRRDICL